MLGVNGRFGSGDDEGRYTYPLLLCSSETGIRREIMSSSLFVPTVIETTGRGERAYDIFSRLLRERIIMVNGQIEETLANLVVAQLLFLAAEDGKREINVYINSPGGSVTAGLAIYDTLRILPCPVATPLAGSAASRRT